MKAVTQTESKQHNTVHNWEPRDLPGHRQDEVMTSVMTTMSRVSSVSVLCLLQCFLDLKHDVPCDSKMAASVSKPCISWCMSSKIKRKGHFPPPSQASVMSSSHLILCHPLLLPSIFPSIRIFSNESVLCNW